MFMIDRFYNFVSDFSDVIKFGMCITFIIECIVEVSLVRDEIQEVKFSPKRLLFL